MKRLIIALSALTLVSACAPSSVEYTDPNRIDLVDDRWDPSDARLTVEEMIRSALSKPWYNEFVAANKGQRPKVVLADIGNDTGEIIDTKQMFEVIRNELINSGKFRFIDGEARNRILQEYNYQGSGTTRRDQAKGPGNQIGADLLWYGRVTKIQNGPVSNRNIFYQIEMRLTSIETSEILWTEIKQISKKSRRSGVRW